jgi:DNA-binding transcriptional LysR family regulator
VLTPIVETDSTRLLEQLLGAGIGYAIVPKSSLIDKAGHSKLKGRPIPGLYIERCLIRRKDLPESRAVREFAGLVRAVVAGRTVDASGKPAHA